MRAIINFVDEEDIVSSDDIKNLVSVKQQKEGRVTPTFLV